MSWFFDGNSSTSLFHRVARQRASQGRIQSLRDEDR